MREVGSYYDNPTDFHAGRENIMSNISPLQTDRLNYQPKLPKVLVDFSDLTLEKGETTTAVDDVDALKKLFPETFGQPLVHFGNGTAKLNESALKVGVVLSGGPAPGGHNVIIGLYDGLKKLNKASRVFGFRKGPSGIIENKTLELTDKIVSKYRNTGGFDMIQSGRTKIETDEQFKSCFETVKKLDLDALLVIGGDDSNTNAAVLAEYFKASGSKTRVIGAPKTIDGDLKNESIEICFGFDTATKLYAELVGNICRDAVSSNKYWHFIKLMGRSASHIALEVGLKTQVNLCLIGEEVEQKKMTLQDILKKIAEVISARAAGGKNYGVILVPEGLIEFIPEIGALIDSLNELMSENEAKYSEMEPERLINAVEGDLSKEQADLFASLPEWLRKQLVADRDPHGNVQVSLIDTELLLSEMTEELLEQYKDNGKFKALHHFFGYEGRCVQPSNFDADYAYGLGTVAALLIAEGLTGYMATLKDVNLPAVEWQPRGVPLTSMMNLERRHGKDKPVIRKTLVDLQGAPYKKLLENRDGWAVSDSYLFPGPIQFYGPTEVCDVITDTLRYEKA